MKTDYYGMRVICLFVILLVLCGTAVSSFGNSVPGRLPVDEQAKIVRADAQARRQAEALERRLKKMEESLETIEARLGRSVHPPTLSRNVERRLQDIEKRMTAIERDLKKLSTLERTVQRMETRLKRVESRR